MKNTNFPRVQLQRLRLPARVIRPRRAVGPVLAEMLTYSTQEFCYSERTNSEWRMTFGWPCKSKNWSIGQKSTIPSATLSNPSFTDFDFAGKYHRLTMVCLLFAFAATFRSHLSEFTYFRVALRIFEKVKRPRCEENSFGGHPNDLHEPQFLNRNLEIDRRRLNVCRSGPKHLSRFVSFVSFLRICPALPRCVQIIASVDGFPHKDRNRSVQAGFRPIFHSHPAITILGGS
jgi:hypothetical protein